VFSGTRRQRPMNGKADNRNAETRRNSAGARGNEHSVTGTHCNYDEHHFKPFEENRLEGRDAASQSSRGLVAASLLAAILPSRPRTSTPSS